MNIKLRENPFFEGLIKRDPSFADPFFQAGYCHAKLRSYTEAVEYYEQEIRINVNDAEAHYNLGVTYLILEDKDSVLEVYKILKSLDNNLANDLFNLIPQRGGMVKS